MTYTHLGKQVLHNDTHYADACDPEAAEAIVEALNGRKVEQAVTLEISGDPTHDEVKRSIANAISYMSRGRRS